MPAAPLTVRRPARGFSLIELLVVIGILTVLATLAVVTFRVVGRSGQAKVTGVQLENCKSLLNEYELTTSVVNLLPVPPVDEAKQHWLSPPVSTPRKPTDKTPSVKTCKADAANAAVSGDGGGIASNDFLAQDTARIVARLKSVPKNRTSIDQIAPERVRGVSFTTVTAKDPSGDSVRPDITLPEGNAVVLIDGFGRPIYFVPGGGLVGVRAGYGSGDKTVAANYSHVYTADSPLVAPDGRPFWASPGPDGDLTTGDDNVYSFGSAAD